MKNDLTTGTWQDDISCPINIILFCTSDVNYLGFYLVVVFPSYAVCKHDAGKVTMGVVHT